MISHPLGTAPDSRPIAARESPRQAGPGGIPPSRMPPPPPLGPLAVSTLPTGTSRPGWAIHTRWKWASSGIPHGAPSTCPGQGSRARSVVCAWVEARMPFDGNQARLDTLLGVMNANSRGLAIEYQAPLRTVAKPLWLTWLGLPSNNPPMREYAYLRIPRG
jgi:hypothetical protein